MTVSTASYQPPGVSHVGGYELDRFVAEYDPADDTLDFRLELGVSVGLYWALPAAPNDRLRVFLVDGAAFHVDEPSLQADPFFGQVPRFEWRPALPLPGGRTLVSVAFEAGVRPGRYRCEFSVLGQDGQDELRVLQWARRLPGGLEGLRSWLACAQAQRALPEGELEDFERTVAELAATRQLDARQVALANEVAALLREREDPRGIEAAARAGLQALR